MGELCLREVTDYEIIGVAIVRHPLDKYAILKLEGQEYNYQVLDYLMEKLDSPFRPWYVEELKRKRPEFINVGRNDKCPCGSGKNTKCVVVALQESMVLIIELLCWVVRK